MSNETDWVATEIRTYAQVWRKLNTGPFSEGNLTEYFRKSMGFDDRKILLETLARLAPEIHPVDGGWR